MVIRQKTDIIIPIYNAYDDLVKCVESVLKHASEALGTIVLIDDASTDRRIASYLEHIQETNKSQITVIQQKQNKGFPSTVNHGLQATKRDVVLLNSDTIVTAGWLDKMIACAYSCGEAGTVTPLSNNGMLCSVPNPGESNALPEHLGLEKYAKIIEERSLQRYPNIGMAMGFCMYIKRKVLEEVGFFDAEGFEKGYGEEQDFCFRASQLGYIHLMCDDTFVYHRGTVSFTEDQKNENINKGTHLLLKRYPEQMHALHLLWVYGQKELLGYNIKLFSALENGKKNILYVVQADFREDASNNVGGTQLHVKDMMMAGRKECNIFVAARDGEYLRLTAYTDNDRYSLKFYIGSMPQYPAFFDRNLYEIFQNILTAFQISLVHVHHTLGLSLDIFQVAHEMKIPTIMTLHDFYTICPTIKMLDANYQLCTDTADSTRCNQCGQKQSYIEYWRKMHRNILSLCDKLIVPSHSTLSIFIKYYPEIEEKTVVIGHGLDIQHRLFEVPSDGAVSDEVKCYFEHLPNDKDKNRTVMGWAYLEHVDSAKSSIFIRAEDCEGKVVIFPALSSVRSDVAREDNRYLYAGFSAVIPSGMLAAGKVMLTVIILNAENIARAKLTRSYHEWHHTPGKINVAFLGEQGQVKGGKAIYKMVQNGSEDINWFMFGGISSPELASFNRPNLYKTGWYKRENLPDLIKIYHIDLVCILSICPETFCYTMSEALALGVPVVVTAMGAMEERVKKMQCGWIVSVASAAEETLDIIHSIIQDRTEYEKVKKRVGETPLKNIADMFDEYRKIYIDYCEPQQALLSYNKNMILQACAVGEGLCNSVELPDINLDLVQRLQNATSELNQIQNSTTYRLVRKLAALNIPFKRQIKAVLYKMYKIFIKLK